MAQLLSFTTSSDMTNEKVSSVQISSQKSELCWCCGSTHVP